MFGSDPQTLIKRQLVDATGLSAGELDLPETADSIEQSISGFEVVTNAQPSQT